MIFAAYFILRGHDTHSSAVIVVPGGGGDSRMKQTGMLVGNFEFNP